MLGKQTDIVGLDIGTRELKAAVVRSGQALRLSRVKVPPGAIVEGRVCGEAEVVRALKRLWRRLGLRPSRKVSFSPACAEIHFRELSLPPLNELDTQLAILDYAEQWLAPRSLDVFELDYRRRTLGAAGRTELELCALERTLALDYYRLLRRAGLEPVSCQLGALAQAHALVPSDERLLLVDIGAAQARATLVEGGNVSAIKVVGAGGQALSEAIAARLGCRVELAEKIKCRFGLTGSDESDPEVVASAQGAMLDPLDRLARSLGDVIAFEERAGREIKALCLLGGGGRLGGLGEQLSLHLGLPLLDARVREGLDVVTDVDLFATAMSLSRWQEVSLLPRVLSVRAGIQQQAKVDRRRTQALKRRMRRQQTRLSRFALASICLLVIGLGALLYFFFLR